MNAGQQTGRGFDGGFAGADIARDEAKVRAEFWDKLKRVAARVPFVDDVVAVYYCAMDSGTPLRVRGMLLAALAYFILPADALPDIIAGLGFTDDAAVIASVIALVSPHIKPSHRAAAAQALGKGALGKDMPSGASQG